MLINSVLFLAVWIISSLAEELSPSDAISAKQTSIEFQEDMRGKKNLIPTFSEHNKLSKRMLMDFQVSYFSIKN